MLREFARANVPRTYFETIQLKTRKCLQFVDLTDEVKTIVRDSGIREGICNIQTQHTTTAITINENEPLLIQDMKRTLERLASRKRKYRHDDFTVRTVNLGPDEEENGHSHCKALFLQASETVNVIDGNLQLGKWQRIFLIELDRSRDRRISVMTFGI
jgi:secondary thiamine-phosphate synthase enzyme